MSGIFVYFQDHQYWPIARWHSVIFSDEKTFQVGDNGQVYVRRPVGQRYNPTYMVESTRSGRFSVPVWACMSGEGGMGIRRIEGHLNTQKYLDIIDDCMVPSAHQLFGNEFTFQQDRSPVHTAGAVSTYFEETGINLLNWPPKGPDMSPIENVWAEMVRVLREEPTARNVDELWIQIQDAWRSLCRRQEYWQNLLNSMPNRMAAVITSRGYFTRYWHVNELNVFEYAPNKIFTWLRLYFGYLRHESSTFSYYKHNFRKYNSMKFSVTWYCI